MVKQPQHSIKKLIINPNSIDDKLLDEMWIDIGIRSLIRNLLKHGYYTAYSCEGHGYSEPYIVFKKGTGDGSFEKEAQKYELQPRKEKICCEQSNCRFCPKCGASKEFTTYVRYHNQSFTLQKDRR